MLGSVNGPAGRLLQCCAALILGVAAPGPTSRVRAQEAAEGPAAAAAPHPIATWRLTQTVKLLGLTYFEEPFPGVDRVWAELEYRPRLDVDLRDRGRAVFEPIVRACAAREAPNGTAGFGPCPDRQSIAMREAYLTVHGSAGDLSAGWQLFSWGKADGIKPLDVFQLGDFTDRLGDELLGIPAVSATAGGEAWTVEGVWVPARVRSRISFDVRNPWSFMPRGTALPLAADEPPETRFDASDGEGAIRLAYAGHGFDAAMLFARTRDHVPTAISLAPALGAGGEPILRATPVYARASIWGATAAVPVGGSLLRVDGSLVLRNRGSGPFVESGGKLVAGGERRIGFGNGLGSVHLIAQYVYDGTAPARLEVLDGRAPAPSSLFRHGFAGKVNLSIREEWKLESKGLLDFETGAGVLANRFTYRPRDGVSVWVGVDVLGGRRTSTIGRLADAGRVLAGLELQQ